MNEALTWSIGHVVRLGQCRGDLAGLGIRHLRRLDADGVGADGHDLGRGVGHDRVHRLGRDELVGGLDAADGELRAAGELDRELDGPEERHQRRADHEDRCDQEPEAAAADEGEGRLAGVEVVSDLAHGAHQSSPSWVVVPGFESVSLSVAAASLGLLALGDRLAALRLTAGLGDPAPGRGGRGRRDRGAELRAAAVDGAEGDRVEARERMPRAEELRARQQLQHRVGEQDEDQHVDGGGETEREREALHRGVGQDVQHDGGEDVDRLRDVDRALRAAPAVLDGGRDRLAVAQLVSDALEVHDERVGREADRDDQARDAGERQAEAHAPGQDAQREVGQHTHHRERRDDDEAERAVDDERVDRDEGETDETRDDADRELLRAERRRDRVRALDA